MNPYVLFLIGTVVTALVGAAMIPFLRAAVQDGRENALRNPEAGASDERRIAVSGSPASAPSAIDHPAQAR